MTTKSDNCLIMHIAIIKVKHKIILAGHSMILQPVYLDIYMPIRNSIHSNRKIRCCIIIFLLKYVT